MTESRSLGSNRSNVHSQPAPHDRSEARHLTNGSSQLEELLYRPIVFREPERLVDPPSWLEHIPFAFWLVDVLRPSVFVELGTHSGNSYAAFAQAVQMAGLSTAAYAVDSWRGDAQAGFYDEAVFEEWSTYHDRHFRSFSRLIRSTFEDAVQHFPDGSIDLLHIDGCHTYEAASSDYERWLPKLSQSSVVVLHDINVREGNFGVWRLWEKLRRRHPHFAFLHGHGLGVIARGSSLPAPLESFFSSSRSEQEVTAIRQFFSQVGEIVSAGFVARELEHQSQAESGSSPDDRAETLGKAIEALHTRLSGQDAVMLRVTGELARLRGEVALKAESLEDYVNQNEQIDIDPGRHMQQTEPTKDA